MSLKAIKGDDVVFPDEVRRDDCVVCPECGDGMTVVSQHYRQGNPVVSHFRHLHNDNCPGGESETHLMMKYTAKSTLDMKWEDAVVDTEVRFPKINRIADVVAKFDEPKSKLGNGIIVEAQYKNKDKAKLATTLDFLSEGYTVIWVDVDDYDDSFHTVEFKNVTQPFPTSVPPKHKWVEPFYHEFTRDIEPEEYMMEATLPKKFLESNSEILKRSWNKGKSEADYSLEYELTENNASRVCGGCGGEANWYLHGTGFRCDECHPTMEAEMIDGGIQ